MNSTDVFDQLVLEMVEGVCFELHFLTKTNQMNLNELNSTSSLRKRNKDEKEQAEMQVVRISQEYSMTSSSTSEVNAQCLLCQEHVSGSRFAAHLAKCMSKLSRMKAVVLANDHAKRKKTSH